MSARRLLLALAALATLVAGSAGLGARAEAAVYWSTSSSIWAANNDGSMVLGGYPYGISNMIPRWSPCGVAVDATHVYWGDQFNDTVGRMELTSARTGHADTFSEPLLIDQALISGVDTCAVAVGGGRVYWGASIGRIGRANVDGSAVDKGFITGLPDTCGVAVDANYVYWGDAISDSIGRARLDGGGIEPEFIPDVTNACALALDASHVYWASFDGGIGRANLDGGDPDPKFIQTPYGSCGVAVDASHVFFTFQPSSPGALVARANLDGSGVRIIVDEPHYGSGCGVAVDSRVFLPPALPASLPVRFGKVKRQRSGKLLTMEVVAPARGELSIASPKLGWSLDKGPTPPPYVGGVFHWRLSLWPGKGKTGKRIRKQLRKSGRAPVTLRFNWTQEGHETLEHLKRLAFKR